MLPTTTRPKLPILPGHLLHYYTIPTAVLGGIQSVIGAAHQLRQIGAVACCGNTYTDRNMSSNISSRDQLRRTSASQLLRQLHAMFSSCPADQTSEFFTAMTRNDNAVFI
jgi:hypothetical protein